MPKSREKDIQKQNQAPSWQEFTHLISAVIRLLKHENKLAKGKLQDSIQKVRSKSAFSCWPVVYLPAKGQVIFLGDIHGDSVSINKVIEKERWQQQMKAGQDSFLVFLGDYTNRGKEDIKTLELLMQLKLNYPNYVYLLRGNHEEIKMGQYFGLMGSCIKKFGYDKGQHIFKQINDLFEKLPHLAVTANGIVAVHGGLPVSRVGSLKNLDDAENLAEIRWNDPTEEIDNFLFNYKRGGEYLFGRNVFNGFMKNIGGKVLIRSHEYVAYGYKLMFDNYLLTIFSNGGSSNESGYQDFILRPKYAKVDLGKPIDRWSKRHIFDIEH